MCNYNAHKNSKKLMQRVMAKCQNSSIPTELLRFFNIKLHVQLVGMWCCREMQCTSVVRRVVSVWRPSRSCVVSKRPKIRPELL